MTTPVRTASKGKALEGPRGAFVVGSLFDAWNDTLGLLMEGTRSYGQNVKFRFAIIDYYLLCEPDAIHHVLVQNQKNYVKSRNYEGIKAMLGQGLLTSEGDFWRKQRKLAQPAFHRDRLASFVEAMVSVTRDHLDRWERELRPDTLLDAHREIMRLTFRIVGRTLLSTDVDGDARAVGDALTVAVNWANDYAESIVHFPPWVPTPENRRFQRARSTIHGLIDRIVAARRSSPDAGSDLLGMLMAAKDEATGEGMSDTQLRDELLTLVLAGHETTANALSFVVYLLSRHPDVTRRLVAEVEGVLAGRPPTLADLKRLEYTTMVIEEAMRLYPPAWMLERDTLEDDVVTGYRVPKGSLVGISPYVLHRNPELYPNPEGFDPERFEKRAAAARSKYHYLPFGGGPRFCIGNAFALMEMQIVLPMLLQRFRLDLAPGFELELEPTITLRPKHGVPVRMRRAERSTVA